MYMKKILLCSHESDAVGITKKQNDKMKNMSKKEVLEYIVNESYTKE